MYRIGFPFWKQVAKAGLTVGLRVQVVYDTEAKVFVATSPDLRGLVVEAKDADQLIRETKECLSMLLAESLHDAKVASRPLFDFQETATCS